MHFEQTAGRCALLAKFGAETGDGVQRPAVHLMPAKNALPRPTQNAIFIHTSMYVYSTNDIRKYHELPVATRVVLHRRGTSACSGLGNNLRTMFIAPIILAILLAKLTTLYCY